MNASKFEFAEQMNRTAIATQSEFDELTIEVYLEKLGHWPFDEFKSAMQHCENELNRFPTIAQIRARRPRRHRSAAEVIEYGGLMRLEERSDERGSDDLEDEIDRLTDEELESLFRWYSKFDHDPNMNEDNIRNACEYFRTNFRRDPQSRCYRGYTRDALRAMKARSK